MKIIKIIVIIFCTFKLSFSQDLLIYKDGKEIEVKVIKIDKSEITYKKYDNIDGPEYVEEKSKIFIIKYENGTKDIFNIEEKKSDKSDNKDLNKIDLKSNKECSGDSLVFRENKYIIICKDNNKIIRYASKQEIDRYNRGNTSTQEDCGSKPKKPNNPFNKADFTSSKEYVSYMNKLKKWENCMGH